MESRTNRQPVRVINSVAPIRICDNGGWTDTWFAGHGKVFNIGVYPYVEVQIEVFPYEGRQRGPRSSSLPKTMASAMWSSPKANGQWTTSAAGSGHRVDARPR